MHERDVQITWLRDFSEYATKQTSVQLEPMSMWPTEVCGFGTDKICVAGRNVKGQTIIRLLQFSQTEELEDAYQDPDTGETIFPDTFIPIVSSTTVYSGNVPGKRLVRTMFKNFGAQNKLIVWFHDSRDLYQLDTQTQQLTLLVASTANPLLAKNYLDSDCWDYPTRGYLYCFVLPVNAAGVPEMLIFVDSDRNGSLELSATMHLVGTDDWAQAFPDQTLLVPLQ
jgi:hypothetical protein